MRGDAGIANPILAAAIFLKFEAYCIPHNKNGGTE
jgi:hypothetical protein